MNVIFFMSDSYRRDNLSCYGPAVTRTPRLDGFAAQAHIFDNAYLSSFPTVPNRMDLMSGRFGFMTHEWQPLPPELITGQNLLTAAGVATQLIADTPHLLARGFNYSDGFRGWEWVRGQENDHWRTAPSRVQLPSDPRKTRWAGIMQDTYYHNTAWWRSEEDHFVARTVKTACQWLEENQDQEKFFLWVDTFDPHEPWDPPQHYVDMYDPGDSGQPTYYPHYCYWRDLFGESELNHMRALYRGEATMVDHWFGVLLDKLDELGMAEDTAVVFASDHGFLFGEHDVLGKSLLTEKDGTVYAENVRMYNDIRRVPLLIRLPGQTGSRHIAALVQSPDLMPTFLELAGLVTSETVKGQTQIQALQCGFFYTQDWEFRPETLHGRSLLPLMRGETDRLRDIAISSSPIIYHTPVNAKCSIVTEDGWCLHYSGCYDEITGGGVGVHRLLDHDQRRAPVEPALYYLPDDPGETHDLIEANRPLALELHARYVAWLEEHGCPEQHLAGRRKLF